MFTDNGTQARATVQPLASLFSATFPGYRNLLDAAQYDGPIRQTDHLYVWRTLTRSSDSALAQSIRDATGMRSQTLSIGETRELEPTLAADIQSGLLLPDNGFTVNSKCLVKMLAANFAATGDTFLRRKVLGVEFGRSDYGGPTRSHADRGTLSVSKLVLYVGAWSMQLGARLTSIRIPLNTERSYRATLRAPDVRPS